MGHGAMQSSDSCQSHRIQVPVARAHLGTQFCVLRSCRALLQQSPPVKGCTRAVQALSMLIDVLWGKRLVAQPAESSCASRDEGAEPCNNAGKAICKCTSALACLSCCLTKGALELTMGIIHHCSRMQKRTTTLFACFPTPLSALTARSSLPSVIPSFLGHHQLVRFQLWLGQNSLIRAGNKCCLHSGIACSCSTPVSVIDTQMSAASSYCRCTTVCPAATLIRHRSLAQSHAPRTGGIHALPCSLGRKLRARKSRRSSGPGCSTSIVCKMEVPR